VGVLEKQVTSDPPACSVIAQDPFPGGPALAGQKFDCIRQYRTALSISTMAYATQPEHRIERIDRVPVHSQQPSESARVCGIATS